MAETELKSELDKVRADMAALRADVAELAKVLKSEGASKAEAAKETIEEEVRKRREAMREKLDEARARGRAVKDDLEDRVEQHPYTSLLAAFGVGFVLAKLVHLGERR